MKAASKTIGSITTIITRQGMEHPYLAHHEIKIVAIIKGAAAPDLDPDAESAYITDDEALAEIGGVTADDRIEVQPWIEEYGRFSFASSDPKAIDLACFAGLR